MKPCVFCKIIKGTLPCFKIYEDKETLAFLDKHPINSGHILVIPKKHIPHFVNLKSKLYQHCMLVTHKLAKKVNKSMNPKRVGLAIAGFDVPHTHIHIIPLRHHNDITSKSLLEGKISNPKAKELEQILKKLKKK